MHLEKEDIEKKQDEFANELCALLERAGRGGSSARQFEVPEYARRRIDVALSSGKLTGHFESLVVVDWKRKEHKDGDVPEARIEEHDILIAVALWLSMHDLRVFRDEDSQNLYVLGIENYDGMVVKGLDEGQLYSLHVSNRTGESWDITSNGATLAGCAAEVAKKSVVLTTHKGTAVSLVPFGLTEAEFVKEMKKKSGT